ncbi:MAG: ankyrin repeat domain-containing protein, partial [Firmicutes bacterium]|nr:ankyrin repeat domain-containing protein [Bacillota bacterium]
AKEAFEEEVELLISDKSKNPTNCEIKIALKKIKEYEDPKKESPKKDMNNGKNIIENACQIQERPIIEKKVTKKSEKNYIENYIDKEGKYKIDIFTEKKIIAMSGDLTCFEYFFHINALIGYKLYPEMWEVIIKKDSKVNINFIDDVKKSTKKYLIFENNIQIICDKDIEIMINNNDNIDIFGKEWKVRYFQKEDKLIIYDKNFLDIYFFRDKIKEKFDLLLKEFYFSECEVTFAENSSVDKTFLDKVKKRNEKKATIIEKNVKLSGDYDTILVDRGCTIDLYEKNETYKIIFSKNDNKITIYGELLWEGCSNIFCTMKEYFKLLYEKFDFKKCQTIFSENLKIDKNFVDIVISENKNNIFETNVKIVYTVDTFIINHKDDVEFHTAGHKIIVLKRENIVKMPDKSELMIHEFRSVEENFDKVNRDFKLFDKKITFKEHEISFNEGSEVDEDFLVSMRKEMYQINFKGNIKIINVGSSNADITINGPTKNIKIYKEGLESEYIENEKKIIMKRKVNDKSNSISIILCFNTIEEKLKLLCENFNFEECKIVFVKNSKFDKFSIVHIKKINKNVIFEENIEINCGLNVTMTNYKDHIELFKTMDEKISEHKIIKRKDTIEISGIVNVCGYALLEVYISQIKENFELLCKKFNFEDLKVTFMKNLEISEFFIMHSGIKKENITFQENVEIICYFGEIRLMLYDNRAEIYNDKKEWKITSFKDKSKPTIYFGLDNLDNMERKRINERIRERENRIFKFLGLSIELQDIEEEYFVEEKAKEEINYVEKLNYVLDRFWISEEDPIKKEIEILLREGIKKGIDINSKSREGIPLLIYAVEMNFIEVLKTLLEEGKDVVDINVQDKDGNTALINSARYNRIGICIELLKNPKIRKDIKNKYGDTVLTMAVESGKTAIVKELLKSGIDINENDKNGETLLTLGVRSGKVTIVMELLKKDIDINEKSKDGNTALNVAIEKDKTEIAKKLLDDPKINVNIENQYKETPLILAIEKNNTAIAEELLQNNDIDVDLGYEPPLILAIEKNNITIAEKLAKMVKTNLNATNEFGQTPLMLASYNDQTKIVRMLLDHSERIEINKICKESNNTALDYAYLKRNKKIISLLITKNAKRAEDIQN